MHTTITPDDEDAIARALVTPREREESDHRVASVDYLEIHTRPRTGERIAIAVATIRRPTGRAVRLSVLRETAQGWQLVTRIGARTELLAIRDAATAALDAIHELTRMPEREGCGGRRDG